MKRIYMTAVVVFATISAAFAQSEAEKRMEQTFTIGPAVGFGHTGMRNVGYDAYFKPSFNAGVTMNYSKWENIGISADILYSMEGGNFKTNQGSEVDVDLNYLRIPIKFAYFFGDGENDFRPKITVGPSLGFMIDNDLDIEEGAANPNLSSHDDYETFDFGGQGSIGFNYHLGEGRVWLNADAYYYHGFVEIDQLNHYNSNFGLRVGVCFGL